MVSAETSFVRARRALIVRVGVVVGVFAGLVVTLRGMDWPAVGEALRSAHGWPIALAAVINFGIIIGKAAAWRLLLAPEHRLSLARLTRYTLISCAASIVLPLRAGELVRVWLLRERDGVPTARIAAVAIAEKLLDMLSMALIVLPVPWLVRDLPASVEWWIAGVAAVAIGGLLALRLASRRIASRHWLGQVIAAMELLGSARRLSGALAVLIATWLVDLAMIGLVLHAVGLDLPFGAALVVLFAVNLAIALPSTPAQLGALELGALAGLHLLHAPAAPALAFAVLYHALQVIPVLGVALITDGKLLARGTS